MLAPGARTILALAAAALVHGAEPCTDLLHEQCNTVANKVPAVSAGLPSGSSVEIGLDGDDKEAFEHLL